MANQYTYVIMNTGSITDQQIADCVQTSRNTLKISIDQTQALLKYITTNGMPDSLTGLGLTTYDQDAMRNIMSGSAWSNVV